LVAVLNTPFFKEIDIGRTATSSSRERTQKLLRRGAGAGIRFRLPLRGCRESGPGRVTNPRQATQPATAPDTAGDRQATNDGLLPGLQRYGLTAHGGAVAVHMAEPVGNRHRFS
jgi:hypothetical protein